MPRTRRIHEPGARVKCSKCRRTKDISEFSVGGHYPDGVAYPRSYCRSCNRKQRKQWYDRQGYKWHIERRKNKPEEYKKATRKCFLKKKYGLTVSGYDQKWAAQERKCALCGRTRKRNQKRFAVDHNVTPKYVRDILCVGCNTGLGNLQHNPQLLRDAADYLERHKKAHEETTTSSHSS